MSRRTGPTIAIAVAVALLAGGIALGVLAWQTLPSAPHHGQAIDGLDGIGRFVALVEGGGALVLLAIGAAVFRRAMRAYDRAR